MLPYVIVLVSCLLVLNAARLVHARQQILVALACASGLTAFASLRGLVGTDTYAYHVMFGDNVGQDLIQVFAVVEPLFAVLLTTLGLFTTEPYAFVVSIGLLQGVLLAHLVSTSRNPLEFLMLYVAIFYLNLHFNVLRAGTAILLLLLASRVPRDSDKQVLFFVYGAAAVLSHYSAILALVPMLAARLRLRGLGTLIVGSVACAALALYLITVAGEAILERYLLYADLLAPDVSSGASMSFILGIPLYMALYVSAVSGRNAVALTLLLLTWFALRWLTSIYTLAGRVEMIANALLLFYIIELPLAGWRRQLRSLAVVALAAMWTYGGLAGLAEEDAILARMGVVDDLYLTSPFTPYRFLWEAP